MLWLLLLLMLLLSVINALSLIRHAPMKSTVIEPTTMTMTMTVTMTTMTMTTITIPMTTIAMTMTTTTTIASQGAQLLGLLCSSRDELWRCAPHVL